MFQVPMPFPLNMGHQPPMGPMFACGPPPHHAGAPVPPQANSQMQQPCQQYVPFGQHNRTTYPPGGAGRGIPTQPAPSIYNQHFFNGPPPPGAHHFTPAGHHCSFTLPSVSLHPFPTVQPPPNHLVNAREQVNRGGHHQEASHSAGGFFAHDHLARSIVQGVPNHHQAFGALGSQQPLGPQHHHQGTFHASSSSSSRLALGDMPMVQRQG